MMTGEQLKLRKIAEQLSIKIQEYINSTTYIKTPLRASDLTSYHAISSIIKESGCSSLYALLYRIVNNKLDYLIDGFTYKVINAGRFKKTEWYFDRCQSTTSKQKAFNPAPILSIQLNSGETPLYFSDKEIQILNRYKEQFEGIVNGTRECTTDRQNNFKAVAITLISKSRQKVVPKEYYEKIMAKYIIYKIYIANQPSLLPKK